MKLRTLAAPFVGGAELVDLHLPVHRRDVDLRTAQLQPIDDVGDAHARPDGRRTSSSAGAARGGAGGRSPTQSVAS